MDVSGTEETPAELEQDEGSVNQEGMDSSTIIIIVVVVLIIIIVIVALSLTLWARNTLRWCFAPKGPQVVVEVEESTEPLKEGQGLKDEFKRPS